MTTISFGVNPFDIKRRETIDPDLTVGYGRWLVSQTDRFDNVGFLARRVADEERRGKPLPRNADELTRRTPVCGNFDPIIQSRHEHQIWLLWIREKLEAELAEAEVGEEDPWTTAES